MGAPPKTVNLIFLAKMGFGMESMVAMLCMFSDNFCEKEKLIADFGGSSSGQWNAVNDDVMGGVSKGGWNIVNDDVMGGVSTGGLEIVNDGVMGGVSEGGWKIVNDDVMGGVSQGASRAAKNVMVFEGNVSLENNGGFSSVQMKGKWNLSTFQERFEPFLLPSLVLYPMGRKPAQKSGIHHLHTVPVGGKTRAIKVTCFAPSFIYYPIKIICKLSYWAIICSSRDRALNCVSREMAKSTKSTWKVTPATTGCQLRSWAIFIQLLANGKRSTSRLQQ